MPSSDLHPRSVVHKERQSRRQPHAVPAGGVVVSEVSRGDDTLRCCALHTLWQHLDKCNPQSLSDLDASLRKLGSRLIVLQGSPSTVFEELFVAHKV